MTAKTHSRSTTALRLGALLGTTALSLSLMGGAAFAQNAPDAGGGGEQVVVTATRANLANFQAPAPTAVIGLDTINKTAATSISTALNENPSFKGLRSPQGNAQNQGSPGQATADLRGLGGQRTVVLIDGNRTVPFAPGSNLSVPTAVDLNMYPTIMIDHAEVVTGGASAQYGSDAVGGVLNLILRNNFTGLEIRGQAGESQYWDAQDKRIAAIVGTNFAGDKGHFVAAIDADDNSGVGDYTKRPWAQTLGNLFSEPAAGVNTGLASTLNVNNVRSSLSSGGLLNGQQFLTPTTTAPYNRGISINGVVQNNGTTQIGGDGPAPEEGQALVPAVRKAEIFTHTSYQVTPNVLAYVDLSYAYSLGVLNAQANGYDGSSRITGTIAPDNAYLPAGMTGGAFTKLDYTVGGLGSFVTNTQPRIVAGLKGDLNKFIPFGDNWKWDAHVSYGENLYHGEYENALITGGSNPITGQTVPNRVAQAMDAVRVTAGNVGTSGLPIGSIACRSSLTTKNGCIPYNFFGQTEMAGQNDSYFTSDAMNIVRYQQEDLAVNLHGEPFHTWAGPVAVATGFEYRQESEVNAGDAIANDNGYFTGSDPSYRGEFAVYEGYLETNIPLADHQFLAEKLNVDGAIREAGYTDVGLQNTWKVGVNYAPIEGLRFRATESYDIRAPQIWELDSPGNAQINTLGQLKNRITGALDPGQTVPQNSSAGNPNLQPEKAYTETIGIVLEPPSTWLGGAFTGLTASLDWYDIDINGAITNTQGSTAVSLCNAGQAFFCNMFAFNAAGTVTSFLSQAANFGSIDTTGYEFVLQYRKNLRDLGLPIPGRLTTAFSASYVDHIFVNPGTGIKGSTVDRAGEAGQANIATFDASPRMRANLLETYDWDKLSVYTQVTFVSTSNLDNTYNTIQGVTIDNNTIPAYFKFDLGGSYNLTQHFQLFAYVNNLMNVWPARSPYNVLNTYANGAFYDKIGRALSLGFDYKY